MAINFEITRNDDRRNQPCHFFPTLCEIDDYSQSDNMGKIYIMDKIKNFLTYNFENTVCNIDKSGFSIKFQFNSFKFNIFNCFDFCNDKEIQKNYVNELNKLSNLSNLSNNFYNKYNIRKIMDWDNNGYINISVFNLGSYEETPSENTIFIETIGTTKYYLDLNKIKEKIYLYRDDNTIIDNIVIGCNNNGAYYILNIELYRINIHDINDNIDSIIDTQDEHDIKINKLTEKIEKMEKTIDTLLNKNYDDIIETTISQYENKINNNTNKIIKLQNDVNNIETKIPIMTENNNKKEEIQKRMLSLKSNMNTIKIDDIPQFERFLSRLEDEYKTYDNCENINVITEKLKLLNDNINKLTEENEYVRERLNAFSKTFQGSKPCGNPKNGCKGENKKVQ